MRRILLATTSLIILTTCTNNFYTFQGVKYRWYADMAKAIKNKEKVFALDLSEQELTSVPFQVEELPNLNFLSLRDNNITELPDFIYNNSDIQVLFLGGNSELTLSSSIINMVNLQILDIIQCELDTLPKEFYGLKSLSQMAIGGNNFSESQLEAIRLNFANIRIIESVD